MKFTLFLYLILFPFIGLANSIIIKDLDLDLSNFSYTNYEKIYNAHIKAINEKKHIDYDGIDTIKLNIPINALPIPLPNIIDFKNVVFVVNNTKKDFTLFVHSNKLTNIRIDKQIIDTNHISIEKFKNKKVLLVIKDRNAWIKDRVGYNKPHIREDILLINNGLSINTTIRPYNNIFSDPIFSYCDVTYDSIICKNLIFHRTKDSTYKTFCLKCQNSNNINLTNIHIVTPKSDLYGDAILTFSNCSNINLSDIIIDGTYSQKDKYGYGISMNNVFNCSFNNILGNGEWGIFGTNNVNTVFIKNSNINRFDIHCYGKDVVCSNTLFHTLYNQFSSFYGKLVYEKCLFNQFIPVTIDGSYSAYTSFNVIFNDCEIKVDAKRPFLFNMTYSNFLIDSIRPELSKFEYPNLFIRNLDIISLSDTNPYYIFHTYKNNMVIDLDNPLNIEMHDLNFNCDKLILSNSILKFKHNSLNYIFP